MKEHVKITLDNYHKLKEESIELKNLKINVKNLLIEIHNEYYNYFKKFNDESILNDISNIDKKVTENINYFYDNYSRV